MVSGTVIDRVTRQPVKSFRVFQGDDESSGRYAEEGRYQVRLYNQSHPNVVRIEAEGYQPASSREITEQKTARVDFELTKGQDAEGVVLTPAGLPAAGAKLAMTSGPFYGYSTSSISNGDLTGGRHGPFPLSASGPGLLPVGHPSLGLRLLQAGPPVKLPADHSPSVCAC
jgi:hypothetical protein